MLGKHGFLKLFFGVIIITLSSQAAAVKKGDWITRFGGASVSPNDSSGTLSGAPTVGVAADEAVAAFINVSYMISNNMAIELLAATPFTHDISATGGVTGKIAEVSQLPPTLSLQYFFSPTKSFSPYVGLGINYTTFFDETPTAVITSIELDDSWGLAAEVGMDFSISKNWFLNADLRYINIETTATTNLGTVDVTLDPWVLSLGVGTTF